MAEGGADAPDIGDEAVLIPCEFCGFLFPISEIIQHESGCGDDLENFSKSKRHETLLESSHTPIRQESEHRNKNAEIPPQLSFKIEQHVTCDTFDIRKAGDGYVLKKVSRQGDEKETAEKNDGSDEVNDIPKQKEDDKIQQSSKKIDGRDELNDIPKQKEDEKIQQNSNKDDGGGKSENVPKSEESDRIDRSGKKDDGGGKSENVPKSKESDRIDPGGKKDDGGGKSENVPKSKESDRIDPSGKKDDGDEFVRKESSGTKGESPKAQEPNSNVHNKTANAKDDGVEFVRKESFDTKGESPKAQKPNSIVHNKTANAKDDGDEFVRKESFDTKGESPKAQMPNRNVHNKTANAKSSAYDDDFSDSSDDNNPENETVEYFIRKALIQAESLKKTFHKSEELEA